MRYLVLLLALSGCAQLQQDLVKVASGYTAEVIIKREGKPVKHYNCYIAPDFKSIAGCTPVK